MTALATLVDRLPVPSNLRAKPERYQGKEEGISLDRLSEADVDTTRQIYGFLGELMEQMRPAVLGEENDGAERVRRLLDTRAWDPVLDGTRTLGAQLKREDVDLAMRKALHDVRGGSFQGLLIHLDLMAEGLEATGDGERLFILARDHRKMMRNALVDLDKAMYDADLAPKPHRVDLLQEKWDDVRYQVGEREVTVTLDSGWEGSVSERCMEFAALDRVIYNLVNNAARFATDGKVRMGLYPVEADGETHLRFVVANTITEAQRGKLRDAFGDQLGQVYNGGFTTGGHGVGLRIVADVVSHGYGLKGAKACVADHFLGAAIEEDQYLAWFFWPAANT